MILKEVEDLIEILKKYPGITTKQAFKIANFILNKDKYDLEQDINNFQSILKSIKKCQICKNYSTTKLCDICSSQERSNKLMIVENTQQILNYEQWKFFDGKYFQIPILMNKKFELNKNIDLSFFFDYIKTFDEIIIAISPTAEGILTTNYLFEEIKNKYPNLKVSKLATGIQMGSSIDYTDKLTIYYALENRKEIK